MLNYNDIYIGLCVTPNFNEGFCMKIKWILGVILLPFTPSRRSPLQEKFLRRKIPGDFKTNSFKEPLFVCFSYV